MVEPFPDQNIRYCSAKSSLLNRYFEIYAIKKPARYVPAFSWQIWLRILPAVQRNKPADDRKPDIFPALSGFLRDGRSWRIPK